jgi:arginyl-tRNA synthetase
MKFIKEVLKQAGYEAEVTRTTNENFGDYTTNIAMVLAKKLGKSPIEIAQEITEKLAMDERLIGMIESIKQVGGYINFYVKPEYLIQTLDKQIIPQTGTGKTVVIDYSAPNIAKPFGIGHLRSTNIGQAIYNIYQALGWKCVGDNHLGDWGTQFGKMITAIKKAMIYDVRFKVYEENRNFDIDKLTIGDLEKLYVAFHAAAESDEKLKDEAREWFAKLEKGDSEAKGIWQKCVEISLVEFNRVYEMLGVKIDYALGEAFYEPMLLEVVKEFKNKELTKESQGAVIVEFDDLPPAMLLKTDEATTYFTRDLATIKYRMERWKPDLIVYEVGSEQNLHFKQVFAAARLMGWEPLDGFYHLGHGLIRWKTGKFSTRSGDTIHLSDVIDNAIKAAKEIAEASKISKEMGVEEKQTMIKAVAIGAVKFSDLSSDPKKDVIFDWEKIMSLEGDSGPYLQYTFARCASLLTKSSIKYQVLSIKYPKNIRREELSLVRELGKFPEKVVEAGERLAPSVVAEYLLALARKYNEFYNKYRIIGEPEEEWRLWLTLKTAETIKKGLGLLGIETVERM